MIITGGIDLSIGTGMALCAVISGVLIVNGGVPVPLGVLGTVLFGGLIGLVNGFNVAILGIPPFIATLAMMLVAQGLALVISAQHADLLQRRAGLHQHLHGPPVRASTSRTPCSSWRWPR